MRLRIAVLIGLLVAVMGAVFAFRFLPPLPLAESPFPNIADVFLLGQFGSATLIGIAVYAAIVAAVTGAGAIGEFRDLRYRLEPSGSESDGSISRDAWEAAFSGTTVESLCYRIIAPSIANGGEPLNLAAPFSPSSARAELRSVYPQRLALSQVWTIALFLPGIVAAAALAAAPYDTGIYLARVVAVAETLLLGSIGFAMLGISIAIDGLILAVARLPLMLDPGIREETQAVFVRLEKLTAQASESDQKRLDRLTENLAGTVGASIEKALSAVLQNSAKETTELDSVRAELTNAFDMLSTKLAQQLSARFEEVVEHFGVAISAERGLLQEELSGFRHTFSQAADRQLDEFRRLAAEDREAIEQLGEVIRQVSREGEKRADLVKAIELMQSVEAYAASLLPAVMRLEGCEERVAAAIAYESETLSRLSVFIKELSGTLEGVRIALSHGRADIAPILAQNPPGPFAQLVQGARPENQADIPNLVSQLRAVLSELEDEKRSSN